MFRDKLREWLENALEYGITEFEFWSMTIAEIERAIEAKKRAEKRKAAFDYTLADLIGHSVARAYNSANKMPALYEAYPSLFDREAEEEKIQEKKDELSTLRFKQFANSFNKKYEEVANTE